MVYIAGLRSAFYYFWVFGLISVLLDLDHIIQVYHDGLELNLENIAYHGTRTLHIPILIFSGCICLVTTALLLRFLYLNPIDSNNIHKVNSFQTKSEHVVKSTPSIHLVSHLVTHSILSQSSPPEERGIIVVECPKCNKHIRVISTEKRLEFPCPACGIEGFMDVR